MRKDEGGIRITANSVMLIKDYIAKQENRLTLTLSSHRQVQDVSEFLKKYHDTENANSIIEIIIPLQDGFVARFDLPGKFALSPADLKILEEGKIYAPS